MNQHRGKHVDVHLYVLLYSRLTIQMIVTRRPQLKGDTTNAECTLAAV
jgi:hypothetical protein